MAPSSAPAHAHSSEPTKPTPAPVRSIQVSMGETSHVQPPVQPSERLAFRPDIEGLRAIAIVAVLLFHAHVPGCAGGFTGVDVFFVISGFLISRILMDELAREGTVRFARFYARRMRRLLPAVALTLLASAAAVHWLVPPVDVPRVGRDIAAAALYAANLGFAAQATDYLAGDSDPSPVLHFWSLGVEEQFYLLWPLFFLLVSRLLRARFARWVIAIALVSFAASLTLTQLNQPWAFFTPLARAWQFSCGALVACSELRLAALSAGARRGLGWLGLALVLLGVVVIDVSTPYPGFGALVPTLGTTLIVVAGVGSENQGVRKLLSGRAVRYAGRISYSAYLWHWPFLVFADLYFGVLGWPLRLAVTAAALVPAILTHHLVEVPLTHAPALVASTARSLALGVATSLVPALCGAWLYSRVPYEGETGLAGELRKLRADLPIVYTNGCHLGFGATRQPACRLVEGRPEAVELVLFGDSHAAQWTPALESIARQQGYALSSWTKSGCPAADVTVVVERFSRAYTKCDAWRAGVLARLAKLGKQAVVVMSSYDGLTPIDRTTGARLSGQRATDEWRAGWARTAEQLVRHGVRTTVLADTPTPGRDMATCVSKNLARPERCDFTLERAANHLAELPAAVRVVDMSEALCPEAHCTAVRAGLPVYRDKHHVSKAFVQALAPQLAQEIQAALSSPP